MPPAASLPEHTTGTVYFVAQVSDAGNPIQTVTKSLELPMRLRQ